MTWKASLAWSAAAAASALGVMFALRQAFQVRTLPERMMEWLLLFVPIDAFAGGIQSLGPQAKVYALYGGIVVMGAILVALGAVALRRRWPPLAVLGLGAALFLLAMGVLMPLTGGGFFGVDLFQHPIVVNGTYGATALTYSAALLAGLGFGRPPATTSTAPARRAARRAFALGAAGAAGSYLVALRQVRVGGGALGSTLPLAAAPPPTQDPQPPTPAAEIPTPAPAATAAAPIPTPHPLPAERQLERDKDGALTAASRAKGELATLITPVQAHYVVTKNAVADPVVDAESWRMVIDGEVNRPVQLDYRTLRQLPAVEVHKTLECISNFTAMCELTYFGCDLISTAPWKGARLVDVLDLAGGLKSGVISLQVQGADEYSSSIPVALATNPDTLVVYEMYGQPLPRQHGFPVRLLSPGRYGYKSCKWVIGIRALRTEHIDWYGQRNWSRTGIVKTMSRIDTPANGAGLAPGRHTVAGIAYAGDRGINAVQFSLDSGRTWRPTVLLEPPLGKDTWVRWAAEFDVAPGAAGRAIQLTSRAIDGTGAIQPHAFALPQPNGGSGHHTIELSATA